MKKKIKSSKDTIGEFMKSEKATVMLLIIIALAVRLFKLSKEIMWTDEGTYVAYGLMRNITEMITSVNSGNHPSFYFILYNLWAKVFGISQVSLITSSILAGVASIIVMYFLVKKMFGRKDVAFISALLACFSLFHFHYSRDATEYVFFFMMIMLSLLSFMLFLKSERNGRLKFCALHIIINALLFYTHHYAFMIILVENLVFFMFIFLKKHRELVKHWIIMQMLLFLLILPGIIPAYVHGGTYNVMFMDPGESRPYGEKIYSQFIDVYNFNTGDLQKAIVFFQLPKANLVAKAALVLINFLFFIGIISSVVKIQTKVKKTKPSSGEEIRDLILLLMLVIVPLLLTAAFPAVYRIKALLLTVLPYSTLLALGIARIPGKTVRCILVLILLALGSLTITHSLESNYFFGEQEDWRGVAEFLKQPEQKSELIVVNVAYTVTSFLYYYDFSLVAKNIQGEYILVNPTGGYIVTIPHMWAIENGENKNYLEFDAFNQSIRKVDYFWMVSSEHTLFLFPNGEIFAFAEENFVNVSEKHFGSVYATRYKRK